MRKTFKFIIVAITITTFFATTELKAKDSDMGFTFGLDYVSNYLDRGKSYFIGDDGNAGVFFPYIFYDGFDIGLSLGMKVEIGEAWVGTADEEKEHVNISIRQMHAIDFNINYLKSIENIVSLNLGAWYYSYQTRREGMNYSCFEFYLSAIADNIFLKPMLTLTYTHYVDEDTAKGSYREGKNYKEGNGENGDIYVQFGIGHSFKLASFIFLDMTVEAGWLHQKAIDPKADDISDIESTAGISIISGKLTFTSSFHYVFVPGTQYRFNKSHNSNKSYTDFNKFYTQFGVAYNL